LLFCHQTPCEVISFRSAENTTQRVIVGNVFRSSSGEMSVGCEAPGQEHDGKKKDHPSNSTLPKITHSQQKYVKPHRYNVKFLIAMIVNFSEHPSRRCSYLKLISTGKPCAKLGLVKSISRRMGSKEPAKTGPCIFGLQLRHACDRNV